jgi:3-oxoacyl-[acyl-carrier-protein] synthase II
MSHKVMITGMGAVSPIGQSVAESFDNAVKGVCGIRKAACFDTEQMGITCAGEVWTSTLQSI